MPSRRECIKIALIHWINRPLLNNWPSHATVIALSSKIFTVPKVIWSRCFEKERSLRRHRCQGFETKQLSRLSLSEAKCWIFYSPAEASSSFPFKSRSRVQPWLPLSTENSGGSETNGAASLDRILRLAFVDHPSTRLLSQLDRRCLPSTDRPPPDQAPTRPRRPPGPPARPRTGRPSLPTGNSWARRRRGSRKSLPRSLTTRRQTAGAFFTLFRKSIKLPSSLNLRDPEVRLGVNTSQCLLIFWFNSQLFSCLNEEKWWKFECTLSASSSESSF